jgi:Glycosyl transferase family 2
MNSVPVRISVVVPTYNRGAHLMQLLRSVNAAWEASGWIRMSVEVVVFDNASVDDTREIVAEFGSNSPLRVVFQRNESNVGPLENVLRAVAFSTGELVTVYGDDDLMAVDSFNYLWDTFNSRSDVAFLCGWSGSRDRSEWVDAEVTVSLKELADGHFYYPGNCGYGAVRGAFARTVVERMRAMALRPSTWVIMDVFGGAACVQSSCSMILLTPKILAYHPNHTGNIILTSHYLCWATWIGQIKSARNIVQLGGFKDLPNRVARNQLLGVNGLRRVRSVFMEGHMMFDLPADRIVTLRAVIDELFRLPIAATPFCMAVLVLLGLPFSVRKLVLKGMVSLINKRSGAVRLSFNQIWDSRNRAINRRLAGETDEVGMVRVYKVSDWERKDPPDAGV